MKKAFEVALVTVLVLGLTTSALAIHFTKTAEEPVVDAGPSKITIVGTTPVAGSYDGGAKTGNNSAASSYNTRVQLGVAGMTAINPATSSIRSKSTPSTPKSIRWDGNPKSIMKVPARKK